MDGRWGGDLRAFYQALGDGVQIFQTFDLENLPDGDLLTATLRSANIHARGSPFDDLGPLLAPKLRYARFSPALWNLGPLLGWRVCTLAAEESDEFQCDVTDFVRRSLQDGCMYARLRLRMEKTSEGDRDTDLVSFFKTDSNNDEPGIFELKITLTP